ncbi:MAG TPA: hypothetical protein VMH01_12255 [Puia sp.]|nr:hypothetical protein [Puia sp.]
MKIIETLFFPVWEGGCRFWKRAAKDGVIFFSPHQARPMRKDSPGLW